MAANAIGPFLRSYLMHYMTSHHDPALVLLSVLIAMFAAYAALDLAGRVTAARGRSRVIWLLGGAVAMGLGIWSMHYIAMLAFALPVPVLYNVPLVGLSLLAAVLASALALLVVSRTSMGLMQALPASVVMGLGISAMHYIGMAAMRLEGHLRYNPAVVALSVLIAIVVSLVALILAFHLRYQSGGRRRWQKLASAAVMGAAIPSMHYTAMAAAKFSHVAELPGGVQGVAIPLLGAVAIALCAAFVLGLAILTSVVDRRLETQASLLETSEMALRQQQHLLRNVIDGIPHLIFVKDWDGRYILANKAMADVYGTTPEALVGRCDAQFHTSEMEIAHLKRQSTGAMTSLEPFELPEQSIAGASGETRWFETIRMPLPGTEGNVEQVLGVATDITRRREAEDALRQSQKMEAVGRLAGGIAHDFNNLLTAITGHAGLLLEDIPVRSPHREDLEEIQNAAQRAAELTRQLLAFSRKQVLQPRVIDLNAVVGGMDKLLRRLIGEDIELATVRGAHLGAVEADPGQIEQVVMNLAVNARDAMPEGGRLTIETTNVELSANELREHAPMVPGRYVMIAVTDTGTGMTEDTKAHIFEPFFTTKEAGKGTGLGLATVYGIVKQSAGFIWVYSEPGRGTCFKVYLPRVGGAPVQLEAPVPAAAGGTETILVVEDEDGVRHLTRRVLESRGYRVIAAASGSEALKIAESHPGAIHLVVTDVVMPRMSGRELADRLLPTRPESRVLYVSGYTDEAIVRHGVLEPGVAFLQKPFSPEVLATKVREMLQN